METAAQESSPFRLLHAALPITARRYISAGRVLMGVAALLLHWLQPVSFSEPALAVAAGYTLWSVYLLLSEPVWSVENPLVQLTLDVVIVFLFAAHSSLAGVWLATVAFFGVLLVAALLYHWHIVLAIVLSIFFFLLLFAPRPAHRLWPAVTMGGSLAVVLAWQRRSMEDRLAAALRRSVLSRSEAETAREQERQRIAADFHDGPLQSFISFQMRLEIIRKLMTRDVDAAMKELVVLQDLGRAQVTELRAFLRGMQPAEVTPATLPSAIRETVEHFERDSGVSADLFCGDLSVLDDTMAKDLLQIVREALNNIRKHSKASRVAMEVDAEADSIVLRVRDDGSGFPFSGAYTLEELDSLRLGPKSIKRRVRSLSGEMILDSRPTEGTSLSIRLPATR